MGLKEIELKLKDLKNKLIEENKRHDEITNKLFLEIKETSKEKEVILAGFDISKIKLANEILNLKGIKEHYGKGDTIKVLNECIDDVANNFKVLDTSYLGCKNYEHWVCQGVVCNYGYAPRHGYVVFEIGLKEKYKRKADTISEEQIEAILHHLNMIKDDKYREIVFN